MCVAQLTVALLSCVHRKKKKKKKVMTLVLCYGFIFLEIVPPLCQHAGEQSVRSLRETIPTSPIKFCLVLLTMKVKD